jgi:hypothetical protein
MVLDSELETGCVLPEVVMHVLTGIKPAAGHDSEFVVGVHDQHPVRDPQQ